MKDSFDLLSEATSTDVNVLITGETGTGKELFAKAIHDNSGRSGESFVVVDCAALQGTLIESILFGYEKGAFTGAVQSREGLIKQADGGTLFLDEMAELPLAVQKVFLRVLQEHRFRPLGRQKEIESNFRLIAATNRDLEGMVQAGQFRKDLLYRLRALTISLPPLREHREDIVPIAVYHLEKICKRSGLAAKVLLPRFRRGAALLCLAGQRSRTGQCTRTGRRRLGVRLHAVSKTPSPRYPHSPGAGLDRRERRRSPTKRMPLRPGAFPRSRSSAYPSMKRRNDDI